MKIETLFDVRGRTAFVTGAGSGLGLAMAEAMAENGAHVTLADIDGAAVTAAAARLTAQGAAVEALTLDVRDSERLAQAIAETAARRGTLDAVFANAGISAGPGISFGGAIETVDLATWEAVHAVNLTSVFVTLRAAAAIMKRQRSGRIIVTASIAGLRAEALCGYAYASAKAAIANLVRQAALELAPFNIMVNAIAPGPFRTNIADGRMHRDPQAIPRWVATVPLGRIAEPSEIQGLALLLASPASSFITGTVIPIDGGSTAG